MAPAARWRPRLLVGWRKARLWHRQFYGRRIICNRQSAMRRDWAAVRVRSTQQELMMRFASAAAGLLTLAAATGAAGAAPTDCSSCAVWNAPQAPFHIYGNTWYVGTHSLSAILIASDKGHILIDGDLEESVPQIADHIRALGFRLEDVKWILNSHVHYDHAGGIAELQRLTGAVVMASPWTAAVMGQGEVAKDDPQFGVIRSIPRVKTVRVFGGRRCGAAGAAGADGAFHAGSYAGRDELELDILRSAKLPAYGLCGQPDGGIRRRLPLYRSSRRSGQFRKKHHGVVRSALRHSADTTPGIFRAVG